MEVVKWACDKCGTKGFGSAPLVIRRKGTTLALCEPCLNEVIQWVYERSVYRSAATGWKCSECNKYSNDCVCPGGPYYG